MHCNSTASPSNRICPGTPSVTLTVNAPGCSIQWQKQDCNTGFADIPGATSATLLVTNGFAEGTTYRAVLNCENYFTYSDNITVYKLSNCSSPISYCSAPGGGGGFAMKALENATATIVDPSIYPNPFNDNFHIFFPGEGTMQIEIMDVLGRLITAQQADRGKEINLDLAGAPKGIYFVKIAADGNTILNKIVKE